MLVLIGKSCTGKDTIKKELINLGMDSVVTTTTRPMRDGEIQDVTYHFVDKSQFKRIKEQGFFAETDSYNTVHGIWYYGTQFKDLNNHENKVIILNPNGIKNIAEKTDMRDWFIVHITCPDEILQSRLNDRGDDPNEAKRRFEDDKIKFMNIERFIDVEIKNDGTKTAKHLAYIIKSLYERR